MHAPRWFDVAVLRLRSLLWLGAVESELDRELRFHLEEETEENVRKGMSRTEARYAAVRRFGGVPQVQEECRDARGASFAENFIRDLNYAVRTLAKSPMFTLVATATLGLGIGANTAIFQLLDAVRMRTLAVAEPQRLAQIQIPDMNFGILEGRDNLSYPLYKEIRANQKAFSDIFAWNSGYTTLRVGQGAQRQLLSVLAVTGGFFSTLGIYPAVGRLLGHDDDLRGCPDPGVVLSYGFWQSEFGGSASAIGARLFVQDRPLRVIGVAPAGFTGPEVGSRFDIALPLCFPYRETKLFDERDKAWLIVMGRLKPGWTLPRATEHLRAMSAGLMKATLPSGYAPDVLSHYLQQRLEAISGATGVSRLREAYDRSLWLLLGLAGLVLLIACANLSNLMLARAGARAREFSVRLALGAGRGRLIRQTLTEGMVLAVAGAASALVLASVLSRAVVHFLETESEPLSLDLTPDWRTLGFTAAIACLTCLVLSLAPAMRAARGQAIEALKSGGRGLTMDRRRFGFQRALVLVQVSVSLILVAGAFLFVGSFRRLVTMDPGFRADGILQASFDLGKRDHDETLLRELLAEVRAMPEVESAATTTNFLIASGVWSLVARTVATTRDVRFTWVGPGFFATIGMPILAGRDVAEGDARNAPKVALVNEAFARMFFPGSSPIGKTFRTEAEPEYPAGIFEVVGLVKNTRYWSLQAEEPPMAFAPATQFPPGVAGDMMFIRSGAPLAGVETALRRRIAGWRPGTEVQTQVLRQTISDSLTRERLLAALTGFFGVLAGLLAAIGLYGVLAYQTVRRRGEIGIRLALGATRGQIVRLVLTEAAVLVGVGLALGVCGFLAVSQTAASFLFGISARDPVQLGGAVLALALAGAAGSLIPARQASRLDPMIALREE